MYSKTNSIHMHIEQDIDGVKTAHARGVYTTIPAGVCGMKIACETWLRQQMAQANVTISYGPDVTWGETKERSLY